MSEKRETEQHAMAIGVSEPIPVARPIGSSVVDVPGYGSTATARPMAATGAIVRQGDHAHAQLAAADPRAVPDRLAVASVACGLAGSIVPVVGQLVGVGLSVAALVRIRRQRRHGYAARGLGWAMAGLMTNGGILLGWLAAAVALWVVGSSVAASAGSLQGILSGAP